MLVKNDNAEAVNRAVQEQREKSKQEYEKKKEKDKQDRELQKQKEKDRKETEKKRTQKGERRRWRLFPISAFNLQLSKSAIIFVETTVPKFLLKNFRGGVVVRSRVRWHMRMLALIVHVGVYRNDEIDKLVLLIYRYLLLKQFFKYSVHDCSKSYNLYLQNNNKIL